MKIYKAEYDMNTPIRQRIGVPTNSDYGLAVGLKKNGEKVDLEASDVTLKFGGERLSADIVDNGKVVFELSSGFEHSV